MSAHVSHSESMEVAEIERVAIWAAYKGFDDILRSSVIKLQSMREGSAESFGSAISPELQSRIEFFGLRKSVEVLRPSETISNELLDLLGLYDELMSKWALLADRGGLLPELQWTTIRHKIIFQIGLCMLKSRLGMDSRTDALVRPDALELPTHFDAEEYEKSLTDLLSSHCYYDATAHTVASKAEKASADILKHALLDVVSGGIAAPPAPPAPKGSRGRGRPAAATVPAGASLNRYRLFFLLNGNTLASMCREVLDFMHDVESKVLPIPTLAGADVKAHVAAPPAVVHAAVGSSSKPPAATAAPIHSPEKEWTAADKKAKGPYASPATKPLTQMQSQLPSQSQSQLMTQVSSPSQRSASPPPVVAKAAIVAEPVTRATRATRSGAASASSSAPTKGAAKRPPVTEAFTQLSDVSEAEESSEEEEEIIPQKKTRGAPEKAAVDNSDLINRLRATTSEFARVMASKDPLLDALAAAPAPTPSASKAAAPASASSTRVTRAALRAEEGPSSPPAAKNQAVSTKVTSHAPASSASKKAAAPSPKKSLHATRKSAEKIEFEESDIETVSETEVVSPKVGAKNKKPDTITFVKSKFPRTLESAPAPAPPRAAAVSAAAAAAAALPKGRVPWSVAEEAALIAGIQRHGVGYWKEILADPELGPVFRDRSNVQLKDKHRNLVIAGTLDPHVPRK